MATEAAERGVFTIAVTNLPSHFRAGLPYVRSLPRIRLALGFHPLAATNNAEEHKLFRESLHLTSFVGEVGLDFSREGKDTRDIQMANFRLIAESVARIPKVVTLHSRGAESTVLEILSEFSVQAVVFHWYSGPLPVLDEAVLQGHYFSVNPAMIISEKGKQVISRIPPDRLLTETDGPYVKIGRIPAKPWDVMSVEDHLAHLWTIQPEEVRSRVWSNFRQMLSRLGMGASA